MTTVQMTGIMPMKIMKPLWLTSLLVFVTCAPALCQQRAIAEGGAAPGERGYVAATAGVSLEAAMSPTFGVEYADNVHTLVQAYATFSYFDNVLGRTMRNDLNALGAALSDRTGTRWEFNARDRGLALTTGAKVRMPLHAAFHPYVGAGAGGIKLTRTITEHTRGNVTGEMFSVLGVGDDAVDITQTSTVRPMAELVGGVGMTLGRTYLDLGYRFRRIFHTHEAFDFAQLSAGVGVRF